MTHLMTKAIACEATIATMFDVSVDRHAYRNLVHWERTARRYIWIVYDDPILWRSIVRWVKSDLDQGTHHSVLMLLSNAERRSLDDIFVRM